MNLLESLAYAISRGIFRAYLEALREPNKILKEIVNDEEDDKLINAARGAFERMRREDGSNP